MNKTNYQKKIRTPYSFKSLCIFLKAQTVIVAYDRTDIPFYYVYPNKKTIINLWHGIPLKRLGLLDKKIILNKKSSRHLKKEKYSYFVTSSDIECYIHALAFAMITNKCAHWNAIK